MDYQLIRSDRKSVSISVSDDLQIIIRAPKKLPQSEIDKIFNSNINAVKRMLEAKKKAVQKYNISDEELNNLIKCAKQIIPDRVEYYSDLMNLKPSSVKITKAKKRFGSCSGKNGICFSCYLMMYPAEAVDYVVVHELAHIKHHNHGKEFYELIEKYIPDYRKREKLLKN
ncbi:MAG: M48 family metallopeptidase [Acetobacter sp.]|nr:M48 family metallopeptidase [Bacteroides sp.]MCM1340499.1 M48 family metallopeptidase [Acetobacter sp.]MCM1433239.1 M48 family metallopeptidase [Clostridiales bacterium]